MTYDWTRTLSDAVVRLAAAHYESARAGTAAARRGVTSMVDPHSITVYVGAPAHDGGPGTVVRLNVTPTGWSCGRLTHRARHSPDGFNWGFRGSGPADLALALVVDVLGSDGRCPACQGGGRTAWRTVHVGAAFAGMRGMREVVEVPATEAIDPDTPPDVAEEILASAGPCTACDGSGFAPLVERSYQRVKVRVVAPLAHAEPFILTDREILDVIAEVVGS